MSHAESAFIPNPRDIVLCRGCRARIFFVHPATNSDPDKRMPVDVEPCDDGNLSITAGTPLPSSVVITPGQRAGMRAAGMPVYAPHFRSCPNADEFRAQARKRGGKR